MLHLHLTEILHTFKTKDEKLCYWIIKNMNYPLQGEESLYIALGAFNKTHKSRNLTNYVFHTEAIIEISYT